MPRELTEAHKKAMQDGRRKKAQARERAERAQRKQRVAELKARLPKLHKDYDKAIAAATRATDLADINAKFNRADQLQNAILGTQRQIDRLEGK